MNIRTAVVVSVAALLGACASNPAIANLEIAPVERVSNALTPEKAEMLLARGFYSQAALAYRSALDTDAANAPARYGLAEAERLGGKPDAAREDYQLLVETPEWRLRALEGLARVDLAKGDRAGASGKFTTIVKEDPWSWRSWLALAQLSDLSRDWAKADEAYALALAATKTPAAVYNNHGVSMLARGHILASVDLFRSALAADPKMIQAATNLDLAEAAAGQQETLDTTGGDAREHARVLNNYGYVAMLKNRPADAIRYYEAAMKEHPSFYALAYNNLKAMQASDEKSGAQNQ